MVRFMSLALRDFKMLLKYKKAYLILLLMPVILIFILGNVFKNDSEFIVDSFNISICNADTSVDSQGDNFSLGSILITKVFKSDNVKSIINITEVSDIEEGKKLVQDKKAVAFVYIPPDFTKTYMKGDNSQMQLIGDEKQSIHVGIVKSILDIFNDSLHTVKTDTKMLNEISLNNKLSVEDINNITQYISQFDTNVLTLDNKLNENNRQQPVSAMQYYAIAMIVMFAMFTSFTLIHSMIDEKRNKIFFRIQTSPMKGLEYAFGKLVGIVFTLTIQMSILICVTTLLYGMKWGNLFYLFIILISYSFAIGTLTLLAALIATDYSVFSNLSMPIVFVLSFLGGSFVRKEELPNSLDFFQKLVPNGQALNAFLKVVLNKNLSELLNNLYILVATGVIFLFISLLVYSRKGMVIYGFIRNSKKSNQATL